MRQRPRRLRRRLLQAGLLVVLPVWVVFATPTPVSADNCGTFTDCFATADTAVTALLGTIFLVGLSLLIDLSPLGRARGIAELFTGRDLLTGQRLAWWERFLGLIPGGRSARAVRGVADVFDATRGAQRAIPPPPRLRAIEPPPPRRAIEPPPTRRALEPPPMREPDHRGRPTGINLRLTPDMLDNGTEVPRRLRPPGFRGKRYNHARGHLWGNQLGGSGHDRRNVVTLYQNVNRRMLDFENMVRRELERGNYVDYAVDAVYRGDGPVPDAIVIRARSSSGWTLHEVLENLP